jgi:UDP-N-acetylmuramoyl-L-alanyl-D-glutamate--2,6-diaminopimelate ligase
MKLTEFLGHDATADASAAAVDIVGITADSRAVKPGYLFAAMPGSKLDGARFVAQAIEAGATAVLVGNDVLLPVGPKVAVVRSHDPRLSLAQMAARFYRHQPQTIVAITGTSGKTSTAYFVRQIWAGLGLKAANLGTLGLIRPDGSTTESLTTPDPVTLHAMLAELAQDGVEHLAMEASSHGLDQRRLDGVRLTAGAFLNLGHDHLDYHKDAEEYFQAKLRLFNELLPEGAPAVINADSGEAERVTEVSYSRGLKVMTVGAKGKFLRVTSQASDGFNQRVTLWHEGEKLELSIPLIGGYQASNALIAAALCIGAGAPPDGVFSRLAHLKGVPGRLEMVGGARGGMVVIDYAHKPDALKAALAALRPFATGRLICVFGCGGDRDRAKRPIMGHIATELADTVIVTDDNPRTEIPATVRAEIMTGARGATEIGDRREAIRAGVAMLGQGDVLLVAGKGHETGQYVMGEVLPFSDHAVVAEELARR